MVSSLSIKNLILALAVISLPVHTVLAENPIITEAFNQYKSENYEETLTLLNGLNRQDLSESTERLKGLAYFHVLQYKRARPYLVRAIKVYPNDRESLLALGKILLDYDEALAGLTLIKEYVSKHPEDYEMLLLKARLYVYLNEDEEAISIYEKLLDFDEVETEQIALELAPLYAAQGKISKTVSLIKDGLDAAPDSFPTIELKYYLKHLKQDSFFSKKNTYFSVDLGYRLEDDDNITVLKEYAREYEVKKDKRHIFSMKLGGLKLFSKNMGLLGEIEINKSKQKHYSQYNELQQYYRLGTQWRKPGYGVYLNYQFSHREFSGTMYHKSHGVTPGVYYRPTKNTLLHGFIKYTGNYYADYLPAENGTTLFTFIEKDYSDTLLSQDQRFVAFINNEYVDYLPATENRSGHELTTAGLARVTFLRKKGQASLYFTRTHDFTYGRNWERVERMAYGQIKYPVFRKLTFEVGPSVEEHDYVHINTYFDKKRKDTIRRLSVALVYAPDERWEVSLEGNWTKRTSNIEYYSYTQRIIGFGINWHYD